MSEAPTNPLLEGIWRHAWTATERVSPLNRECGEIILKSLLSDTHGVAAQLKLLADCPEKIWVCLEGRGYMQAAQHYLLARHVYSHLGLHAGGKGLGPGTRVQKLWQPIANFKDAILEVGREI